MSNHRRWLLYVPEIEPKSFFFFYYVGQSGRSYSVRTYWSPKAPPRHRTQADFDFTADEIMTLARHREQVPKHRVTDSQHWYAQTKRLNDKYLGRAVGNEPRTIRQRASHELPKPTGASPFVSRDGASLTTMADWQAQHPEHHWRAGYSAMELARSWSSAEGLPQTFQRALNLHPFRGLTLERGVVEHNTDVPGKGRASCTDLMVTARTLAGEGVVIGVEGKVDESFGPLVSEWIAKGGVNRQARLDGLCEGLGLDPASVGGQRYQLFHRCYAALATARDQGCVHAVMAVHSLEGRGASGDNWRDFVRFARAMGARDVVAGRPVEVGERMGRRFWLMWVTERRT